MNPEIIALYEPGERITCLNDSGATILAGELVTIVGKETAGQRNFRIRRSTAGESPAGAASWDTPNGSRVTVIGPGHVLPLIAGAALSAGRVAAGALGRVVAASVAAAVAASRLTGVVADNNAIRWTARQEGTDGNGIRVQLLDPAGNDAALAVDVDGLDIIVSLATGNAGAITSTAAQVRAAVNEHDAASGLVVPTNEGASSGAGVVTAAALAALTGGSEASTAHAIGVAYDAADADGDEVPVRLF